uniref:Uncharacterized protein n=1 Tax=Syphacia muris TaxID=451379 RepID=A0A0N5AN34_9BILA
MCTFKFNAFILQQHSVDGYSLESDSISDHIASNAEDTILEVIIELFNELPIVNTDIYLRNKCIHETSAMCIIAGVALVHEHRGTEFKKFYY